MSSLRYSIAKNILSISSALMTHEYLTYHNITLFVSFNADFEKHVYGAKYRLAHNPTHTHMYFFKSVKAL